MNANNARSSSPSVGFRRRHSAPHPEDSPLQPHPSESHHTKSPGTTNRRMASDPPDHDTSTARRPSAKRQSCDRSTNRVRFSLDENFASHGHLPRLATTPSHSTVPRSRPGTPRLSVNVDVGKASGNSLSGEAAARSPLALCTPDSPQPSSPMTPRSPRTRDRGFSLRRSLFSNNVQSGSASPRTFIELQEPGPSDLSAKDRAHGDRAENNTSTKKIRDTIISVAASPTREELIQETKKGISSGGRPALPNYETWIRQRAAQNRMVRSAKVVLQQARKHILRINDIPPTKDGRHLDIDASRKLRLTDERTGRPYLANTIRSSRYNLWNFLPRQLLAQFSKLANFYFLCVAILQMIPGLSTTGRFTTIVPLLFFVSISIAREGFDDLRRYRLDKEENNRSTSVLHAYKAVPSEDSTDPRPSRTDSLGPIHWTCSKWKDVQVGDIVKLKRDEAAPADLVLLHSDGENGAAYVETMALDGETNLKSKFPTVPLAKACDTMERMAACAAHLVVEDPNVDLYTFEGRVTVNGETCPLTNKEVIYRGSILRNTPKAIGIAIYSGEECKIRMNASKNPRIKAPALQALVNKIVVVIVIFVLLLSVYNSAAYEVWSGQYEDDAWYLSRASVAFGPIIVSFIIMFNTMIPLSLYVSLEIVKVAQMFLLNDIDMYDEVSNTPMEARTSTINEELGQISYIFSDKTGTLTNNSMKFRKISVAGTAWLHDSDIKADEAKETYRQRLLQQKRRGKKPTKNRKMSDMRDQLRSSTSSEPLVSPSDVQLPSHRDNARNTWDPSARPCKRHSEMHTLEMLHYVARKPHTVFAKKAKVFLLSIALCHTCLPEHGECGTVQFQAASPDELALVEAAQELGYLVVDRSSGILTIKTSPQGPGKESEEEKYEILDVLEFSSKRKRMSTVVRFPDKRICVISKGADSIMMQLLRLSSLAVQKVVEIEKKASGRKKMEANQVIARKSEQHDLRSPLSRKSSAVSRPSIATLDRFSSGGSQIHSLGSDVNTWLSEREHDQNFSSRIDSDASAYSPRPSESRFHSIGSLQRSNSLPEDDGFELVEEGLAVDEEAIIERCFQHVNDFATEGLRTLLYGYRFLTQEEYASWKKIHHEATTSIVDRQAMIERAAEMVEQNLELAGATAIEDKLQKGVPEAIDKLRRANIRMWMLTGDKRETAINIGHSCRLVKDYSTVTVLDHEDGQVEYTIAAAIVDINRRRVAHSVVVVDGHTLSKIEGEYTLRCLFMNLAIIADGVICCRASPSQKAGLVKAIRQKVKKSITLAIGDGANDIAMIQEAHVGIGITGKEGLQAARTSDYSIAQFRFLTKLLLVHGRWNYLRTCKYTLATFWKEMTFYLTQALYQRWAGYTGTSLYESWSLSMFNTLFTSLPVIFLGIFEKDLNPSTLLAVPELYAVGQKSRGFNIRLYLWWMFLAGADCSICYFLPFHLYASPSLPLPSYTPGQTQSNDLFPLGDLAFTSVVVLVGAKVLALEMHNISGANAIAFLLCVGGWFLWNVVLSSTYHLDAEYIVRGGFVERFGRDPAWWATLGAVLAALFVVEVGVRACKVAAWPSDAEVFQSLERDEGVRARFEEASREELRQGWEVERESSWGWFRGLLGKKRSVAEGDDDRPDDGEKRRRREEIEQEQRENEIRELLRTREGVEDVEGGRASPQRKDGSSVEQR